MIVKTTVTIAVTIRHDKRTPIDETISDAIRALDRTIDECVPADVWVLGDTSIIASRVEEAA